MKVGFIGAGKVGCSLGNYFMRNNIPVVGFYSRTQASASEAAKRCNTAHIDKIDKILTMCDVLFLTVPDDAVAEVWKQVKAFPIEGKYICHCSGSLSSAVLSGIEETGAYGYSIHPMFPFKNMKTAYEDLKQALFTVEGDADHMNILMDLLKLCGNQFVPIQKEDKGRYHAAAVYASNLMVGLISRSMKILETCGFCEEEALCALKPLAVQNLDNIFESGIENALTGPVERHDVGTVNKHLQVLDEQEKDIYIALTKEIIQVAETKHPDVSYADMKQLLEEEK